MNDRKARKKKKERNKHFRRLQQSNEILQRAGMSDEDIVTGRLQNQMQQTMNDTLLIGRLMTACGEVLRDDFGFSQGQLREFATAVSVKGREMAKDRNDGAATNGG